MAYQSFEDLEVWKRACRLAVEVNQAVGEFRNYALKDQMCRAGISIPSNIAEGHERDSRLISSAFSELPKDPLPN